MMLPAFSSRRLVLSAALVLFAAQFLLVFAHIGAILLDTAMPSDNTAIIRAFFELSKEGNAPTWFSSLLFTLIGFTCGALYAAEGYAPARPASFDRSRLAWLLFAGLFLFLSFDETSQLHERLDWMMSGLPDGGAASAVDQGAAAPELPFYRYLLIYVPVLAVAGLAMTYFVMQRFQQPFPVLLFLGGMGLLASKLVIESFEKWSLSVTWMDHSLYLEAVIIEMSCLFTGATLILTALLTYLSTLVHAVFMRRPATFRDNMPANRA